MSAYWQKSVVLFPALICFTNYCHGQLIDLGLSKYRTSIETPYRLDLKKDIAVSIGAAALIGTGFIIKGFKPEIDSIDLISPDISKIPSFDQYAIHQYDDSYVLASDILEYTAVALPFLAFIDKRVSGHAVQIIAMYLETLAINAALTSMTKGLIHRRRPFTYNTDTLPDGSPEVPFDKKNGSGTLQSFFSSHTSNAATATFFGARVFTDLRPQSVLVPFVWGLAAAVPAFTGFSRVQAGRHYLSDVVAGYLVGASVGFFNPTLHKIKFDRLALYPSYNGNGIAILYTF